MTATAPPRAPDKTRARQTHKRARGKGGRPLRWTSRLAVFVSVLVAGFLVIGEGWHGHLDGTGGFASFLGAVAALAGLTLAGVVVWEVAARGGLRWGWQGARKHGGTAIGAGRSGVARGWRRVRTSRAPGAPAVDWDAQVPGPGPWELSVTSKTGASVMGTGHPSATASFTDRGALIRELERLGADEDLELAVRSLPDDSKPEPPPAWPGTRPAPRPAAPPAGLRPSGGTGMAGLWLALVSAVVDSEPDDDEAYLEETAEHVDGMTSLGEAFLEMFDNLTGGGPEADPLALQGLLDFAEACTDAADAMSLGRHQFAAFYAEHREAAASGRPAPKDGKWITGGGEV